MVLTFGVWLSNDGWGQSADLPATAVRWEAFDGAGYEAWHADETVWLVLQSSTLEKQRVTIRKLNAPLRQIGWVGADSDEAKVQLTPEPDSWLLQWRNVPNKTQTLRLEFDVEPLLPEDRTPCQAAGDGSLWLPAHSAITFGDRLRYEPQSYKNTVGYWTNADDYVAWDLEVAEPGRYAVAVLQGCGNGQGGSTGEVVLYQQNVSVAQLEFAPIETGHFQNFRWNHLGFIDVPRAGRSELRIRAKQIQKAAFCDIRAVHLIKQATR